MTIDINLCTVEDVLKHGGLSSKVSSDYELIEELISDVTDLFHTYCNVEQFKSKTYTEYYDGRDSDKLFLNHQPIISVTAIYDDIIWQWSESTLIDPEYYRVVDKKYVVIRSGYFKQANQNLKVIYQAGFEVIPAALKRACIKEVLREFNRRKDFDVLSKTLDDGTVNYVEKDLLAQTKTVLKKYKVYGIY